MLDADTRAACELQSWTLAAGGLADCYDFSRRFLTSLHKSACRLRRENTYSELTTIGLHPALLNPALALAPVAPALNPEIMRNNNQPITQMETLLPEGRFIYSRTDLRGIIVEANEAFAHISGYRREDMIGQPRWCADMPEQALKSIVNDIRQARNGLVKKPPPGRRLLLGAGQAPRRAQQPGATGYQSVRSSPSRRER
ncbi:MAG: PAS domain S-box protein [Rivihabitans pingtungensis]